MLNTSCGWYRQQHAKVCVCVPVPVPVCVCVRERERERESNKKQGRETDRERDHEKETERQRDRETERARAKEKIKNRETEREREREREIHQYSGAIATRRICNTNSQMSPVNLFYILICLGRCLLRIFTFVCGWYRSSSTLGQKFFKVSCILVVYSKLSVRDDF